jgi:hypothetical protein
MTNWCIYWFFKYILMGILNFKWLIPRSLYKSFGVKGLIIPLSTRLVVRMKQFDNCKNIFTNFGDWEFHVCQQILMLVTIEQCKEHFP